MPKSEARLKVPDLSGFSLNVESVLASILEEGSVRRLKFTTQQPVVQVKQEGLEFAIDNVEYDTTVVWTISYTVSCVDCASRDVIENNGQITDNCPASYSFDSRAADFSETIIQYSIGCSPQYIEFDLSIDSNWPSTAIAQGRSTDVFMAFGDSYSGSAFDPINNGVQIHANNTAATTPTRSVEFEVVENGSATASYEIISDNEITNAPVSKTVKIEFGTNTVTLYVNGSQVGSWSLPATPSVMMLSVISGDSLCYAWLDVTNFKCVC